jgi:hypothetical protein
MFDAGQSDVAANYCRYAADNPQADQAQDPQDQAPYSQAAVFWLRGLREGRGQWWCTHKIPWQATYHLQGDLTRKLSKREQGLSFGTAHLPKRAISCSTGRGGPTNRICPQGSSQILNPKLETRNKSEIRKAPGMLKTMAPRVSKLSFSDLEFVSGFELRISDLIPRLHQF